MSKEQRDSNLRNTHTQAWWWMWVFTVAYEGDPGRRLFLAPVSSFLSSAGALCCILMKRPCVCSSLTRQAQERLDFHTHFPPTFLEFRVLDNVAFAWGMTSVCVCVYMCVSHDHANCSVHESCNTTHNIWIKHDRKWRFPLAHQGRMVTSRRGFICLCPCSFLSAFFLANSLNFFDTEVAIIFRGYPTHWWHPTKDQLLVRPTKFIATSVDPQNINLLFVQIIIYYVLIVLMPKQYKYSFLWHLGGEELCWSEIGASFRQKLCVATILVPRNYVEI